MARKSADLLQALLQRQKAIKAAPPAPAPTPEPVAPPKKVEQPRVEQIVTVIPPPPPPPPPTPPAAPVAPKLEPKPAAVPQAPPAPSLLEQRKGITLSYQNAKRGALAMALLLIVAFYFGRASAGGGSAELSLSTKAPSVSPFQWKKGFTVQAVVLGLDPFDRDQLSTYENYLQRLGALASPVEVIEAGSGKKRGALFIGSADRAKDESLIKLRDWLRGLPGPDGSGRPFKAAEIREIPRSSK